MRKIVIVCFLLLFWNAPAMAGIKVVATLPWIGSLAQTLGGDLVEVAVLVKPNQDPHMVEAKPSMILAGRKADILMYNGLDLEIGYLPLILQSSRNPKIAPGKPGHFNCSRFVAAIEKPTAVDRSLGDVHPLGNPHYHFSPTAIGRVAVGMSEALAALDDAHAETYRANYRAFAEELGQKQTQWRTLALEGKRFVAYHKLFEYLAAEFGLQILGYVEPKPGIPPSAGHVEDLIAGMRRSPPDAILTTAYYGRKEAESLGEQTGVPVVVLPADVGAMEGTGTWFAFMDRVLSSLR